jgi:hypothetical protein
MNNEYYDYDDKSVYNFIGQNKKSILFMQEFPLINKKMILVDKLIKLTQKFLRESILTEISLI